MTARLKRKWAWPLSIALALVVTIMPAYPTASIEAQPPALPHQFYGTVTLNGSPAPSGTTVQAYVGGTLNNSTTVDSLGRYGYSSYFTVTGTDGQTITFYIGGTLAPQTAVYSGGAMTLLNLAISTTTLNVVTNPATGIGSTVATLNGNLSNMGGFGTVNVWFQYGTTMSYGSTTLSQPKAATGTFSASVSGLSPLTSYYFRAVAQSGTTTVYGSPLTLTTTASGLSVSTSAASGVGISSATLNGNLNDLGPNSSVNVYFEYGPSMFYGYMTPAQTKTTAGAFSASISSLVAGTTYHYRAIAVGTTTVYGEDTSFTTSTGTLTVQTDSATSIGANSATLNGTLISLGGAGSGNVYFQYGTTTSYGSMTPPQSKSSGGAFNNGISSLTASTTYHFRAVAQAGATTVYGSDASFTTSSTSGDSTIPPHQFYGKVYINGVLAPSGTGVAAYVNGVSAASTTTDSSGRYGYTTIFNVPGGPGTVTFYVNGILTPQTATWSSGSITQLNLISSGPGTLAVTTNSANYATTTTATLSGSITGWNSSESSAATSFIWGTTSGGPYPNSVTGSPSPMYSTGTFAGTMTGLTAGQTYYIKARAVGTSSGEKLGAQLTYVHNPGGTLTVTTDSATYATTTTATLSGSITAWNTSDSSATTSFVWGTSNGGPYPNSVTGSPSPMTSTGSFTGTMTGLTAGQTYYIKARAVGTSSGEKLGAQLTYVHNPPSPLLCDTVVIGACDNAAWGGFYGNIFFLFRFKAKGGTVTTMNVKPYQSGKIKMAIYDDVGGNPGTLLSETAAATVTGGSWQSVSISSTTLTADSYYWLAWISSPVTKQIVGFYVLPIVGGTSLQYRSSFASDSEEFDCATFVFPTTITGGTNGTSWAVPLMAGN